MEEMDEKELEPVTPQRAMEIYRNDGIEITLEEAEQIVKFLYKLAEITLAQMLRNPQ